MTQKTINAFKTTEEDVCGLGTQTDNDGVTFPPWNVAKAKSSVS